MGLSTNPVHSGVHISPSGVRKAIGRYLAAAYRPISADRCDRSGVALRERALRVRIAALAELIPLIPLLDHQALGVQAQDSLTRAARAFDEPMRGRKTVTPSTAWASAYDSAATTLTATTASTPCMTRTSIL